MDWCLAGVFQSKVASHRFLSSRGFTNAYRTFFVFSQDAQYQWWYRYHVFAVSLIFCYHQVNAYSAGSASTWLIRNNIFAQRYRGKLHFSYATDWTTISEWLLVECYFNYLAVLVKFWKVDWAKLHSSVSSTFFSTLLNQSKKLFSYDKKKCTEIYAATPFSLHNHRSRKKNQRRTWWIYSFSLSNHRAFRHKKTLCGQRNCVGRVLLQKPKNHRLCVCIL